MISSFSVSCLRTLETEPHDMQIDATAVRQDVERALHLYVTLELFRVGSNMGRLVIDETRATKPPRKDSPGLTPREKQAAMFRRALYAKPEVPHYENRDGSEMRRVAPLRDVADIVKLKAVAFGSSQVATDRSAQLWRSTISTKLARIARVCVVCRPDFTGVACVHVPALLKAARLKIELEQARNVAKQCGSILGSGTRRQRLGRRQVTEYEAREVAARRAVAALSDERLSHVRTDTYREALVAFYNACDSDEATRRYCLRIQD